MKTLTSILFVLCTSAVLSAAQFTLRWADNSNNETGFAVERSVNGTVFVELARVGENTTSYVDSGLPNSTQFWYRVRAFNAAGYSGYSNTATGTTPALPAVPGAAPGNVILEIPGQLVNISTRGIVPVGNEPLIGGFVVQHGPARVLIRGVGPGLTQHGVSGVMADPQLRVFRDSTVIATNDNWSGTDISGAAETVGAFALTAGSRDSALLLTLPAGSYTVHLSGVGTSTGAALVEIYQVP